MGRYLASKRFKTRRYKRDSDQILHDDLSSEKAIDALENQAMDEYKPGLGQFYCVPCARYCETDIALKTHQKSKVHRRQLKALKFGPYTKEEADAGAGKDVQKYLNKRQQQQNITGTGKVNELLTPPVSAKAVQADEMATDEPEAVAVVAEEVEPDETAEVDAEIEI